MPVLPTKKGLISQRVPKDTERKLKKMAKQRRLPEALCLQFIVEEAYTKACSEKEK